MPVGVDTDLFTLEHIARKPKINSILRAHVAVETPRYSFRGIGRNATYGGRFHCITSTEPPLPKHVAYTEALKTRVRELALDGKVSFYPGIPYHRELKCSAHEIFVNLGASGMYDKMLFEAAASGCIVLAASRISRAKYGTRVFHSQKTMHLTLLENSPYYLRFPHPNVKE